MRRLFQLAVVAAVCGMGCGGVEPRPDAGTNDAGTDLCVLQFPERFDVDTTVARGCYLVARTPVVGPGVTVTLSPGAKLVFAPDTRLVFTADQVLTAAGTQAEPIVFTASVPARGAWRGLQLEGTQRVSTLDWVVIEYAGDTALDRDAAAVKLTADSRGARLAITNTIVRESEGFGLWATGSAVFPAFANNTFTANTLGPVNVDSASVAVLDAASKYAGNTVDRVHVRGARVSGDVTWNALDVPYFIAATVTPAGVLTVQPGARFVMDEDTAFKISGDAAALDARGTAERPIVFTGHVQTRGAWSGLSFSLSNNPRNQLAHVVVEYAGSVRIDRDAAAIKCTADSHGVTLRLDHVTMRQSQGWGLFLTGSAQVPLFAANRLTENTLGPARVHANVVHVLGQDSVYAGNDVDKVYVEAGRIGAAVRWQDVGVPYLLHGEVWPAAVWTLDPGVTLEMADGAWLSVSGDAAGLNAAGTDARPITFTGATRTPGAWRGIELSASRNANNVFDHCVIEYGGGGQAVGWGGMLYAHADSHGVLLTLTNSTVRHSALYGVWLSRSVTATMSGNTFTGNASGDVFRQP